VANQYPWCSAAWFERTASAAQVKTIYRFKTDKLDLPDDFDPRGKVKKSARGLAQSKTWRTTGALDPREASWTAVVLYAFPARGGDDGLIVPRLSLVRTPKRQRAGAVQNLAELSTAPSTVAKRLGLR